MSCKMDFTGYLESFPIAKVHSFLNKLNFARVFIASTKKKKESFFENQPAFPFDKCPTTTSHFSNVTENLSN